MATADRFFSILEAAQADPKRQAKAEPTPWWVEMLRGEIEDGWTWIVSSIAGSRPSEVAYINANCTHAEIMTQYAMLECRKR